MGDRILSQIIPILREGMASPAATTRQVSGWHETPASLRLASVHCIPSLDLGQRGAVLMGSGCTGMCSVRAAGEGMASLAAATKH